MIGRIRGRAAVRALFEDGVSARARHLVAKVRPNDAGMPRVMVAPGRRLGGAVLRNRIKRRLRAAAREVAERLPHADVALLPQRGALDAPFPDLCRSVEDAVRKAWTRLEKRS